MFKLLQYATHRKIAGQGMIEGGDDWEWTIAISAKTP
jgi:hypothetical protein